MKYVAMLLLAVPLFGQVTVADTIRAPISGQLFTGRVTIQAPEITFGGQTYSRNVRRVEISNGAFLEVLIPNVGATPEGTTYRVTFRTRDGVEWSEWWEIPNTTAEVKIFQVRRASNTDGAGGSSVPIWKLGEAAGRRGRVLLSDGASWVPANASALGVLSYTQTLTAVTSITVLGATHGLGTNYLLISVYDAAGRAVATGAQTINATTYDVTVSFTDAQTGRLVLTKAPASSVAFNLATTVSIPGSTHGFASQNLAGTCFDAAGKTIGYGSMTIAPSTYDVTFTFTEAQSGRCFVSASSL